MVGCTFYSKVSKINNIVKYVITNKCMHETRHSINKSLKPLNKTVNPKS